MPADYVGRIRDFMPYVDPDTASACYRTIWESAQSHARANGHTLSAEDVSWALRNYLSMKQDAALKN